MDTAPQFKNAPTLMMVKMILFLVVTCLSLTMNAGCSEAQQDTGDETRARMTDQSQAFEAQHLPEEMKVGEEKFNANCSKCHGLLGNGTGHGPPLVHKIYEPHHHADFAFQRAAAQGVRAHHWKFGNMPKIENVTPDDVRDIIKYVRWLQRQAGIY